MWLVARDRVSGADVPDAYWSGIGTMSAEVVSPDTGLIEEREFFGVGGLISVSDIPLVSNVSIQRVTVTMSQVADRVNELIREYDCKQARIDIWRGVYDPATRVLVAPAEVRFAGFVDVIEVSTPAEGGDGGVVMTCASHTQEMTRSNSDTRSDASQKLRSATDNFYQDTTVVGEWEVFWGQKSGKTPASKDANLNPMKSLGLLG